MISWYQGFVSRPYVIVHGNVAMTRQAPVDGRREWAGEGCIAMAGYIFHKAWHYLTRVSVAAILIAILLVMALLGSCFPQFSPPVAADAERLAAWETGIRARYGPLADLLATARVFRWFYSPLFLIPLALLTLSTLVCTLDRWRGVWRQSFHLPLCLPDAALDTAPYVAHLVGTPYSFVREQLVQQGFRVRSATVDHVLFLRGDRNRLAPLATLVTHLALILLLLGAILSNRLGWREELVIEPGKTAIVGHGNNLSLRNDRFVITRYPDGNVAAYQAEVVVSQGSRELNRASIQVNQPLAYGGVGVYLQGYEEKQGGYSLTLLAVRDPGYGLVMAAGFLLLLGLTVSFNFPHCWIHARIGPDGALRLAGRAERRACDFDREFNLLVERLSRPPGSDQEDTS